MTRARDLADSADKDIAGTLTLDGLTVDGNVGIGTSSPSSILHVSSSDPEFILTDTSTNVDHSLDGNSGTGVLRLHVDKNSEGSDPSYIINMAGSEAMRIDSSGNVGIGTSSPGVLIEGQLSDSTAYNATGNADTDAALRILNGSSTTGAYSALKLHSQNANGNVGQWAIASISTSTDYGNDLAFHTRTGSSTYAERMRLNNDGSLSLGNNLTNPDNSLLHLTANNSGNFSILQLESNEGGSATAPDIALYRNSASPADNDNIGQIIFYANNSASDRTTFGGLYYTVTDVTDGSEDSRFRVFAQQDGTYREFLGVGSNAGGTGEVCVNDDSADINFRVESNANANAFIVDAGANFIGMHTPTIAGLGGYTERVRIASDGNNLGGSLIMSANNAGRTANFAENDIVFHDTDSVTANSQGIGNLRWYGLDASGAGAGYKHGIKGRAQGDGSAFFEFYTSSSSANYVKSVVLSSNTLQPGSDNVSDLGTSGNRWDDVWATNATINQSDERLKQQVAALSTNEINAAKAISALFITYKWNDKVAEKGDNARIHSGVIAQQVKAAMEANSLDPMKYAFMCWNEFYQIEMSGEGIATPYMETFEVDDPDIPEGATYVDRYSIRYSELMSFIHAATEQRLASIETRLDALEAE